MHLLRDNFASIIWDTISGMLQLRLGKATQLFVCHWSLSHPLSLSIYIIYIYVYVYVCIYPCFFVHIPSFKGPLSFAVQAKSRNVSLPCKSKEEWISVLAGELHYPHIIDETCSILSSLMAESMLYVVHVCWLIIR